jgi:hypothetical protein
VPEKSFQPNLDRISILASTILLAYTFAGLINISERVFATQLPGIYLEIKISTQTVVSFLAACLAASGTNWLLRDHPSGKINRLAIYILLPAITAWIIGVPIHQQALGFFWWVGILLGGGVLILVLMAEFTVVDTNNPNYVFASAGLTILAYALLFLLSVTLKASQIRLYQLIPPLMLMMFIVSLRILHLRSQGKLALQEASLITLIIAQISIAAYYLPFSPISFGLFLLGPAYGFNSIFANIGDKKPWKEAMIDPVIAFIIFGSLAFIFH